MGFTSIPKTPIKGPFLQLESVKILGKKRPFLEKVRIWRVIKIDKNGVFFAKKGHFWPKSDLKSIKKGEIVTK